jgi:hypothetical protein
MPQRGNSLATRKKFVPQKVDPSSLGKIDLDATVALENRRRD